MLWHCWLGDRKGIRPVKRGMVEVGAGWSGWSGAQPDGRFVCLLIFPCTIKSRSSLLAPAHPGGPGKTAIKWLWWWWVMLLMLTGVSVGVRCWFDPCRLLALFRTWCQFFDSRTQKHRCSCLTILLNWSTVSCFSIRDFLTSMNLLSMP